MQNIVAEIEDEVTNEVNDEGGWDIEDLELPLDVDTSIDAGSSLSVAPTPGMPVSQIWIQKSSILLGSMWQLEIMTLPCVCLAGNWV